MRAKVLDYLGSVAIYCGLGLLGCILTSDISTFLAIYNGWLALVYLWVVVSSKYD